MDYTSYYQNLLILQYRDRPRALAVIAALVQINILYDLLQRIKYGFNINNDVDVDQETLASITGIAEQLNGIQIDRICFGYKLYGAASSKFVGYKIYGDPDNDYIFPVYGDINSYTYKLTPNEMRIAIKFATFRNSGTSTLAEIHDFMYNNFSGIKVADNQDMTLIYSVPKEQQQIFNILLNQDILPKPTGVGIEFVYT
jgi:hypothetical protein